MIIMKGIHTQASIMAIVVLASQGEVSSDGFSQPSQRSRLVTGPKRYSSIDLPIIQLTATGESMKGSRKATRKNFCALMSAFSSSASPKAMAYCTTTVAT
jgi:hypothetical protein